MINQDNEILAILQEECAEVIQAVSKINRFGYTSINPRDYENNRQHLEEEIGDLICMVQLLIEHKIVDSGSVDAAALNKRAKLKKWSGIFN